MTWGSGSVVVLCEHALGYLTQAHFTVLLPTANATTAIMGGTDKIHNKKKT